MNQGFSFMWEAGELPILIPPAVPYNLEVDRDQCRTADRIEHCVPVFREEVELVSGAPVVCRSEDAREPPDDLRLASGKVGWQNLRDGRVLVQRRVPTFAKPDVEALDLRTTWLVNTTEWFPLENQVKVARTGKTPKLKLPLRCSQPDYFLRIFGFVCASREGRRGEESMKVKMTMNG